MAFGQAGMHRVSSTLWRKRSASANALWIFGLQDTSDGERQSAILVALSGAYAFIIPLPRLDLIAASRCIERPCS
jgi:hypothetical protein